MSAVRYRQFLELCERWPRDPSKRLERDLSPLIRKQILGKFPLGEATPISHDEQQRLEKLYRHLNDLASNRFRNEFKAERKLGALGLPLDQCHVLNSDEFAAAQEKYHELSWFRKKLLHWQYPRDKMERAYRDTIPFSKK